MFCVLMFVVSEDVFFFFCKYVCGALESLLTKGSRLRTFSTPFSWFPFPSLPLPAPEGSVLFFPCRALGSCPIKHEWAQIVF